MINLLIVEDDEQQRNIIETIVDNGNFQVTSSASVEEAILILKSQPIDVIFSDWKLGNLSGIDLLNFIRKNYPHIGFSIATAYGTIAHAVEAMEAGADDYLAKPFQRQALLLSVDKAVKAMQLRSENSQLNEALVEQNNLAGIIGNAPCMAKVYERLKRVSHTNATVLINGESGTGKELAARALHELSNRSGKFIAINCGAIPESLAEAELFGAIKGAYTGADSDKEGKIQAADKGTLFLDEIGELPLTLQAKLLRFLQEGTVVPVGSHSESKPDVRVVVATHRNLMEMAEQGEFREDLYYRLNVVPLVMPPLRERREDIPKLINHFLDKFAKQYHSPLPELDKNVLKQLLDFHWPGNVRELSNRVERYILLDDVNELINGMNQSSVEQHSFTLPSSGINWEEFEKQCLQDALRQNNGNKTKAAKFLQLGYKAFLYRLEKHSIG
ncbi:sigma-54 dependent transcriptional regulator [Psychrobium sp. MM17-31]|uniref:sigma-54-dependent transcriptional regulator n=1 Tax=Psychrobium sp. MM17-31 TaxID=2917758 RepID=UPI001EF5B285|nr:sigma-54 dependent transcriptional regulator [Psychrobium sp. MM17-31]MCG7533223.1 sigma-54 dependent transcriptional regulator [Psychrobium sp. MM17-31]